MEEDSVYDPGKGERHSTQIISLLVGVLLFILGLSGILFSGFAGLHLSAPYSTIIAVAGALLFYTGYKNKSRDAFICCLTFTIFFGLHAVAGWVLGEPGVPRVGYMSADPKWLTIIPHFHELGKNDHILNTVLSLVLLGGTIDWFRRNTEKGHRKENVTREFQEFRDEHKRRPRTNTNRPIQH